MIRFKVLTDMNKEPREYAILDLHNHTIIASGLHWISASFICDALNEKQERLVPASTEGGEG